MKSCKPLWRAGLCATLALGLLSGVGAPADVTQENDRITGVDLRIDVHAEAISGADRRPIETRDLLTLKEISALDGKGLSISPDGRYVAFELHQADLQANDYRVAWFIAPIDATSLPINVGDAGDPLLFRRLNPGGSIAGSWASEAPVWSPDSRWIYYRRRVAEQTQLWRSRIDGRVQEIVTHNRADIATLKLSRDGSKIFLSVDATREEMQAHSERQARDGYLFDTAAPNWSTAAQKPYYEPYSLTGGQPKLWIYEFATRSEREATAQEVADFVRLEAQTFRPEAVYMARTRDGNSVAWLALAPDHQPIRDQQPDSNPSHVLTAARSTDGRDVPCPFPECTGRIATESWALILKDGLWWSEDGSEVYFARKEGANYGHRVIYAWNVDRGTIRRVFETGDWLSDCSHVSMRAICLLETPAHPRRIVAIDLRNGTMEAVVDPNPEFHALSIGRVSRLEWDDGHGQQTFGFLVTPPDDRPGKRYPLVVVGYRAAFALRGGVGDEYPVHVLASNGFAVLVYDMPERWTLDAAVVAQSGAFVDLARSLAAIESAIDLLDRQGIVDPVKVGITGLSTGASQVSYSLIHSRRFAVAAASSLYHNPTTYFTTGAGDGWRKRLRELGLGPPGGPDDGAWKTLSLALHADLMRTPLLVNSSDFEFPDAMESVVRLAEARQPFEVHVYPNEYHVKWSPQHRLSVYERNVDWFNFWLRDHEDPAPNKAEQYERWRAMRASKAPAASHTAQ